ncbi:MAG: hypothetical protein NTU94_07465 [Planctomycetota bacterium]|jgi:hypothetical protein|nr:hypothetical protein [Planctomycetota bacterium]
MTPNEVTEPLEPWVERVIDRALLKHERRCVEQGLGRRLRVVEVRIAWLVGYMVGSGLLGGAAGAMVYRAFGG